MFRRTVDEVSNLATHSRYFGREISPRKAVTAGWPRSAWTISSREPRGGDTKAMAALQATARDLGLGLLSVVNAVDRWTLLVIRDLLFYDKRRFA
ncbi:MAG TPA: hypothetical protein VF921_05420, partial [Vicinamibacterales bacterium]